MARWVGQWRGPHGDVAMSSDLQRMLWNDIYMLLPRKEVQAPVSGEGEGGRWLCAQPVALGHSPVIGVHGPGHSAGNRPHLAADAGAPLHDTSLRTNPLHPIPAKPATSQ